MVKTVIPKTPTSLKIELESVNKIKRKEAGEPGVSVHVEAICPSLYICTVSLPPMSFFQFFQEHFVSSRD